jgi:hypothetical protein
MVEDAKREGWRLIEFDGEIVCGEDCERTYLNNHGRSASEPKEDANGG